MDLQQDSQLLTFSYARRVGIFSPIAIDLDMLQRLHPGVKAFLSSSVLTNCVINIHAIKASQMQANVYMVENISGVKLILKVLPTNDKDRDDTFTEMALTRVTSDLFVSPQCVQLRDNFILLPYIGGETSHFLDAAPFLSSEQSFARVLKRLGLLHGANIIPQKAAVTHFNTLNLLKSKGLNTKHTTLDVDALLERIKSAYSVSDAASSATNPVFIHANLTPLNIVENAHESYLIDWKHAGKGNPYFDLGAVFAMYALSDDVKLHLIRKYYPNTITNKLPEEDTVLLKELNLFSAIYWFNIALSIMNTTVLDPRQSLFLIGCQRDHYFIEPIVNQKMSLLTPLGQKELVKTALCESQVRMDMMEKLNCGNRLSF